MAFQLEDLSEHSGKIVAWFGTVGVAVAAYYKLVFRVKKDKRDDHSGEQVKLAEDTRDRIHNSTIKYLEERSDRAEKESSDWRQRCWAAEELGRIENAKVVVLTARCSILERQIAHMNGNENE